MTDKIKLRILSSILLHALGDTIGYKNGDWEFSIRHRVTPAFTLELLYEFIDLGGVNHIDLSGWLVSDDTILSIAVMRGFLEEFNSLDELCNNVKKEFIVEYDIMEKDKRKRLPGISTMKYIGMLKNGSDWDKIPYDPNAGGSGASMRCYCIGLMFRGEKNRDDLIKYSIETSRMTHNNAVGYLGGLTAALFTAYAMEDIEIEKWPHMLVKLLLSDKLDKYFKDTREHKQFDNDKHVFIDKWQRYIVDKFDDDGDIVERKASRNMVFRGEYYASNFGYAKVQVKEGNKLRGSTFIGSGGDDSVIIAYDSLVDAENNWEKLIMYAMLHIGDTDTTGCIAGAWFGAYYGMDNVPKHMFEHLEFKDKLKQLADGIFKKFPQIP